MFRSTPNLLIPEESAEKKTPEVVHASPLAARRVHSASSIQKSAVKEKEKRYSAIFTTLRDAVNEDKAIRSKSMDSARGTQIQSRRKATTLGSRGPPRKSSNEVHPFRHSMCNLEKLTEQSGTIRGVS